MRFVHTADWQIGKPFARISDPRKRALVNQARVAVVGRIGRVVEEQGAEFVLVAGDLFDSPSVDKATVSAACGAIGRIPVPVIAIPGNHDHAGPGSIWEQEFFMREREQLAPNLVVLTEPGVYRIKSAFILACPLRARTGWADPTEWVRTPETWVPSEGTGGSRGEAEGEAGGFGSRDGVEGPRIVLAHGSTQVFVGRCDDEDELERTSGSGFIDLTRCPITCWTTSRWAIGTAPSRLVPSRYAALPSRTASLRAANTIPATFSWWMWNRGRTPCQLDACWETPLGAVEPRCIWSYRRAGGCRPHRESGWVRGR